MKLLDRADIEALFENPEQASLQVSPQILREFMDGYWVRADGKRVRMTEIRQLNGGELLPIFTVTEF